MELHKYENDPEYRELVDGISEDAEAVEAATLTDGSSDGYPSDVDDLDGYGTNNDAPADETTGTEAVRQPDENGDEEVPSDAEGGEEGGTDVEVPSNGNSNDGNGDLMDADNEDGSDPPTEEMMPM